MSISGTQWADMLRASAAKVFDSVDELTLLDSVVGDGDHGVNLAAGFREVLARFDADEAMTAQQVLRATGDGLQEAMAGTAGLLLGRFFVVASRAIDDCVDSETIAAVLRTGSAEIAKRGCVKVGDRSMFDALSPAADRAEALYQSGASPVEVFAGAAEAAKLGSEGTAWLVPRVGRAARATDEATGQPDAGSVSVALILQAWAEEIVRSTRNV